MPPDSSPPPPDLETDFAAPAMSKLLRQCQKIARSRHSVLLTGESGTGKSRLAQALHAASPRAGKPLVEVSCAAISAQLLESELFGHRKGAFSDAHRDKPGLCQIADGGTLFLDEIGEMERSLQPKLLLFLQEQRFFPVGGIEPVSVDVRVIAATNRNLAQQVAEGSFREDLFFRLNTFEIEVPPLRERRGEIPVLALKFLRSALAEIDETTEVTFSPSALDCLLAAPWRGNIRELRSRMVRVATLLEPGEIVQPHHLEASTGNTLGTTAADRAANGNYSLAGRPLREIEAEAVRETLAMVDGHRARAAALLGVSEKTVYNLIQRHGLS